MPPTKPRVDDPAVEYSLLYFATLAPEQADLRAAIEEISREGDAIRELTKAIEEIDAAYVPTYFSS